MTPRERVLATLQHREPDRLAVDFGGTDCSGVHLVAHEALRRKLGLAQRPVRLACLTQQLAEVTPELQDYFGSDATALYFYPQTWTPWKSGYGFDVEVPGRLRLETLPDGATVCRDGKGVIRSQRPAGGLYFDPANFVFANAQEPSDFGAHPDVFDRWDWPAVLDESVEQYGARARQLRASTDRAIVAIWQMHYLQAGEIMRGFEQFLVDLMTNESMARGLLDRLHAVYLDRVQALLRAAGDQIDIVFFADDLGAQNAPLLNPVVYRRILKPYWNELIARVKKQGLNVVMHSCGAVADFIPDLIEMGVDALNPVQITAAGMSPLRLKRDFGRDISFWGGASVRKVCWTLLRPRRFALRHAGTSMFWRAVAVLFLPRCTTFSPTCGRKISLRRTKRRIACEHRGDWSKGMTRRQKDRTMKICSGLFDHMVLQRTSRNVCDALVTGTARSDGCVTATIRQGVRPIKGWAGRSVGVVRQGWFSIRIDGVPAGGPYNVQLEVLDPAGRAVDGLRIRDVLVGDVWILAGQSNMQGCGDKRHGLKKDPEVRAFFMDDHWGPACEPVHDLGIAVDPVHVELCGGKRQPVSKLYCAGPGLSFAQRMKKINQVPQGVIACAHGATSLTHWDPALRKLGGRSLYGAMLRRITKNGGRIAGMLWYQGCNEATADAEPLFTQRMKKFVAAVRRDTGIPDLPFVQVQIARMVGFSNHAPVYWNSIQEQQRLLPRVIPRCLTVPAIDLPLDDLAHLSGASGIVLGRRLAQAMDVLQRGLKAGRAPIELKGFHIEPDEGHATANVVLVFANVEGRLQASGRPRGFVLRGALGDGLVCDTKLDGNRVIVRTVLSRSQLNEFVLHYGLGMDPFCNITDAAGRSLPVFGPLPLGATRATTGFVRTLRVSPFQSGAGKLHRLKNPRIANLRLAPQTFASSFCSLRPAIVAAGPGDKLIYYVCDIDCAEAMSLGLLLGYDGPVKIWVDKRMLFHDPDGTNPAVADAKTIRFKGAAGRHQVVIALGTNNGAAWGVFLRFERFDLSRARRKSGPAQQAMPVICG